MGAALGLIVALSFGSADFLGGRASRPRLDDLGPLFVGQLVAVVGALVVASSWEKSSRRIWLSVPGPGSST